MPPQLSSAPAPAAGKDQKIDATRKKIEKMEAQREERRRAMQARKKERAEEEQRNIAAGNPGDVDFIGMMRRWREDHADEARDYYGEEAGPDHPRVCVAVRKRPISDKERAKNDHDSVTCLNPVVWIHSAKLKVDGITKYLDHASFQFDYSFNESVSTDDVYNRTTLPLLDFVCSGTGGRATVFAYGQTGSGKTYTMNGIQQLLCQDLFQMLNSTAGGDCTLKNTKIMISFFELYAGQVQDLLNEGNRLKVLEDGNGQVQITGLKEVEATDTAAFLELLETGNEARTTHTTEANDTSSRSHAICQILLRERDYDKKRSRKNDNSSGIRGKLSLVDLAGSERGSDTKSHNAQRRNESADINRSLLGLKECIRALDKKGAHVNYRASKLTLILKDCFTSSHAMTTMIATVSPGASAADHSLNTLRYADRVKEKRGGVSSGMAIKKSPTPGAKLSPVATVASATVESKSTNQLSAGLLPSKRSPATAKSATTSPPPLGKQSSKDENKPRKPVAVTAPKKKKEVVDQKERERVEKENEHRRTIEAVLELEDEVLGLHFQNIQENADLLTSEGRMLQKVQQSHASKEEFEHYAAELETILERKEEMIIALQEKLVAFQNVLQKEQDLSKQE